MLDLQGKLHELLLADGISADRFPIINSPGKAAACRSGFFPPSARHELDANDTKKENQLKKSTSHPQQHSNECLAGEISVWAFHIAFRFPRESPCNISCVSPQVGTFTLFGSRKHKRARERITSPPLYDCDLSGSQKLIYFWKVSKNC